MSQVSPTVTGPALSTASLRMPPPFCTAASGAGAPADRHRSAAAARRASACRLPWLVAAVRTMARRPSRSTRATPITWESAAATAPVRGSTTAACTPGSGATSAPTPTDRPVASVTRPAASKTTVSAPMHR